MCSYKNHWKLVLSDSEYQWLLNLPDDLGLLIYERDFEKAIAKVEKARQLMLSCTTPQWFRYIINERVTTLSELLMRPAPTKTQIEQYQEIIERWRSSNYPQL
jgi:hypothetical protein